MSTEAKKDEAPAGWKPINVGPTEALCHSDRQWWESPTGEWFCGTCHPTPWLGRGYMHPNDRIMPCQHEWSTRTVHHENGRTSPEPGRCMKCGVEP